MYLHKKLEPRPNWRNIQSAAQNHWVDRVPLYEHSIGAKVIFETTGYSPDSLLASNNPADIQEGFRQYWDFWRQMGYDSASMEFKINDILPGGGALGGHKEGCIKDYDDFKKYPWQDVPTIFYKNHEPYIRKFIETCPSDMRAVGGVGYGLFESVQDIVGYMNLCYIRADDEELYADIFRAMGEVHFKIWDRFMHEFSDKFCVLRFGDDLGFNTQTLLAPDDIRKHIIPHYKRVIARVHQEGKPFLLHSCGKIFEVMDDMVNAGIDAKHSNEDSIAHFSQWVERYGDKIANFGGIDTDVLCTQDRQGIREYIIDCLQAVKGHGGIAFGSGNSIPDYVPTEGYLAMVETVREWRGDCV